MTPCLSSPCSMCTGAILLYKIPRVVIGENVNFVGDEELLRSRGVKVVVLDDEKCKALMAQYIREDPEVLRCQVIAAHTAFDRCLSRTGTKISARRLRTSTLRRASFAIQSCTNERNPYLSRVGQAYGASYRCPIKLCFELGKPFFHEIVVVPCDAPRSLVVSPLS